MTAQRVPKGFPVDELLEASKRNGITVKTDPEHENYGGAS